MPDETVPAISGFEMMRGNGGFGGRRGREGLDQHPPSRLWFGFHAKNPKRGRYDVDVPAGEMVAEAVAEVRSRGDAGVVHVEWAQAGMHAAAGAVLAVVAAEEAGRAVGASVRLPAHRKREVRRVGRVDVRGG